MSTIEQATKYLNEGQYQKYIDIMLQIHHQKPNDEFTNANITQGYILLKEYQEALKYIKKAISTNPKNAQYRFFEAECYEYQNDFNKAISILEKAMKLKNITLDIYLKLGFLYCIIGNDNKSIKMYQKAIKKFPNDKISILQNYILRLLKHQDFNQASILSKEIYNNIGQFNHYQIPELSDKKLIKDKKILILENEGIGDNINFLRYADVIKEFGAKEVKFLIQSNTLKVLFENNNFIQLANIDDFKNSDFYIQTQNLPKILTASVKQIPRNIDIFSHLSKNTIIEVDKSKLNIGFSWRGSAGKAGDDMRSIYDLSLFQTLFDTPNTLFYSLQFNDNQDIDNYIQQNNIIDTKPKIASLIDTINIIRDLDLVISVDTAIAHISATLNKPTFIMVEECNDWRWFDKINHSLWYDKVTIFRQKEVYNWQDVVKEVKVHLENFK